MEHKYLSVYRAVETQLTLEGYFLMESIDYFNAAFLRAEHYLTLYDILHDTRARRVKDDWADRFKEFMHWPIREDIVRIDGKDKKSLLIIKSEIGIERSQFTHEYLSELLRSSLVSVISALDMYLHDIVVTHSWSLLSQKEELIPSELKRINLPIVDTKRAIARARKEINSRPGYLVKQAIQAQLHKKYTFQSPDNVNTACRMLGVKDLWNKVAAKMNGNHQAKDITEKLWKISRRRNQIVHEADLILTVKHKRISIRKLTYKETREWVYWIKDLVLAIDEVIKESF